MTNLECLATAFPLHVQRIAECVYAFDARGFDAWVIATAHLDAGWALCEAFDWTETEEGYWYWGELAAGAGFLK